MTVQTHVQLVRTMGQRVAALRHADPTKTMWQRAGEQLLIEHGSWLRRDDFCAAVLEFSGDEGTATIRWEQASDALADAITGSGTADDLVVLAFAVALGTDRFGLSHMDERERRRMLAAITAIVRSWDG